MYKSCSLDVHKTVFQKKNKTRFWSFQYLRDSQPSFQEPVMTLYLYCILQLLSLPQFQLTAYGRIGDSHIMFVSAYPVQRLNMSIKSIARRVEGGLFPAVFISRVKVAAVARHVFQVA